ncbi:hypothetical protein V6C31_03470 [Caldibacillus debilis]|uniref:hypothetical protein n=1 Tax=Caldibacillus debilis TaxID=301148 RepID=UPI000E38DB22|nr:hypothetical protein [Caldibacillus debilis]REJ24326.1 MAG: hypothetical protein C6W56_14665 [Caldibacillus debilis]
MTFEIYPTTAEHIINATDAVLLKRNGCDENFVASFMDVPDETARNALRMAEQIGLVKLCQNLYYPLCPFATYLATGNEKQKAIVIRLLLEQYEPYRLFKERLIVTGFVQAASEQIRVFFGMSAHREVIKNTLTSLGTYSQSLLSEGAGLYRVAEEVRERADYILGMNEIVSQKEQADIIVRKLLGPNASSWIDPSDTLEQLVIAYLKLSDSKNDPRGPILYAGNAFESFLVKFADHHNVSLQGATGINSKIDKLNAAGKLNTKHKFMGKYLGHVRNACEHGIDPEIGQSWQISQKTSHEYVHLTMTCIEIMVDSLSGVYRV